MRNSGKILASLLSIPLASRKFAASYTELQFGLLSKMSFVDVRSVSVVLGNRNSRITEILTLIPLSMLWSQNWVK